MINTKNLLTKLLFAVWLIGSAGLAQAMPYYHVTIDTADLGSDPAYLGLSFLALGSAEPASATVTNLTGALVGAATLDGSVSGSAPGPLVFSNSNGGGNFMQALTLGGSISFDVSFTQAGGDIGTSFGWSLFNDVAYLGMDGDLGDIFLQPDAAPDQMITLTATNQFSRVDVVPEPSTVMLMLLAGCGMLVTRRRMRVR
jgi:hypothetical protein